MTSGNKRVLTELEEILLYVLSGKQELYGLQISKTIEDGSKGKLQIGFGSLYPALRRMEARKFVTSHWGSEDNEKRGGARRRYYKITSLGEETLEEKQSIRENISSYKPELA